LEWIIFFGKVADINLEQKSHLFIPSAGISGPTFRGVNPRKRKRKIKRNRGKKNPLLLDMNNA